VDDVTRETEKIYKDRRWVGGEKGDDKVVGHSHKRKRKV